MQEILIDQVGVLRYENTPEQWKPMGLISDVISMNLKLPNRTMDLLGMLPPDWKLGIGYVLGDASPYDKEVRLGKPEDIKWLAQTMHEFGHVDEYQKPDFSLNLLEMAYGAYQMRERWILPPDLSYVLGHETRAWTFALTEFKKMDLPEEAMNIIHKQVCSSLGSYLSNVTNDARLKQAATNGEVDQGKLKKELLSFYDDWMEEQGLN